MKRKKHYNHLLKLMICGNDLRENIFVNFENNICTITEGIVMLKNWYFKKINFHENVSNMFL